MAKSIFLTMLSPLYSVHGIKWVLLIKCNNMISSSSVCVAVKSSYQKESEQTRNTAWRNPWWSAVSWWRTLPPSTDADSGYQRSGAVWLGPPSEHPPFSTGGATLKNSAKDNAEQSNISCSRKQQCKKHRLVPEEQVRTGSSLSCTVFPPAVRIQSALLFAVLVHNHACVENNMEPGGQLWYRIELNI